MNKHSYAAETIKERINMQNVIAFYVPGVTPRHNRIPCPIHNGQNFNLSFSDKLFYCFKCGAGGDVINFVQHIFNLPFKDAITKINTDFRLGLPLDRRLTLREQREAKRKLDEITAAKERQEAEKAAYEARYDALWDEYTRLDKIIVERAPKSPDEEFDPTWIEAVKRKEYVNYLIDTEL